MFLRKEHLTERIEDGGEQQAPTTWSAGPESTSRSVVGRMPEPGLSMKSA
ncbi:MAG: hypothetical protein ABSB60_08740 [Terracidiphilus sp.]|jgi:hypothetical protein